MRHMSLEEVIEFFKMVGIDAKVLDATREKFVTLMSKAIVQEQTTFIEATLIKDIFERGLTTYKDLLSKTG